MGIEGVSTQSLPPYFIRGRRWGAEIGDCVVVAVLASCKAMLGRRDGEQKLSISKRRRTLYGRAEIGNKNQKIQLKKSAKLFNLIKKTKDTD